MVAAQPGVGLDQHQFGAVALARPAALQPQGVGQLGGEGQGAEAPPEFMADGGDHQQARGHHRAPENAIARHRTAGIINETISASQQPNNNQRSRRAWRS